MFFVRSASARDIEKVAALLSAVGPVPPVPSATLTAWLARPDAECVVADDGKTIAGFGYAAMALKETVQLHMLCVDARFRRRGIARDLFAELETCFPDARRMRVEVAPGNAAAIAFFDAHGFAKIVEHAGTATVLFEKALA
ncbi:GNAT family N-acetyltransferase [Ensifer soli]|uniref:GNAT family N-acetyltransferase n=1 Tax=Ciceribacter sp. sgz301302 TaxID=3342379 RepID=UPI0035B8EC1B